MSPHKGAYEPYTKIEDVTPPLGILRKEDYWAFLNLICLIATLYTMFPLHIFGSKFRRKKELEKSKEIIGNITDNDVTNIYNNKDFYKKFKIGWVLELVFAIIALILFIKK